MRLFRQPTLVILLMLLLSAATAAALPDAFTREGDPALYAKLHKQAEQNLRRLDSPQRKAYKKILREQDDILMSYLLAYESDANLAQAEPQAILSNYREIADYLARYGTSQATEFFLSFVADQTVSDERIEAYRAALLDDGLREILERSTDELELYRAVSQWCVGRLKFQPTSGRDQSPLDITQRSILGRCEEMQILFVAAARTVGLPARPASTPWWPHTDNNHAWAEVWLDGAWHYTGDMDAAYYPDQTWFSGLIDKTVLILADGSLPSEQDEVLVSGRYDCVINSIRNYAGERTRRISVTTVDEDGQPLGGASLGILVYNWNALRPLIYLETDAKGRFSFSAGRGAFYLSAYKDGKQALQLIPSGEIPELEFSLILTAGPLSDQNEMLHYPSNPFQPKQAPEVWNEGVRLARQRWNDLDRSYQDCGAELGDSLLCAFAVASRGNYPNLRDFLDRTPDLDPEFLEFLLSSEPQYLDPKFLWQADARQLEALYRQYQLMRERFSPQDLASVIAPTVFYEELSRPYQISDGAWAMYPRSFFQEGDTRLIRLNKAMNWLKRKHRIAPEKALQGLLPLHIAAGRKQLSSVQYRMLAVQLARANGVPAEFTRQPNLIWVQYDNGQWGYYDLKRCAPEADVDDSQAFCGLTVLASDTGGAPLSGLHSSLSLSRFQNGAFYWLDQEFRETGAGRYAISVPKGEYYLKAGYRVSDSQTAFQMRHLDFSAQDSLSLELTLREYPRKWAAATPELLAILDSVDTAAWNTVLIGHPSQENSIRLAEKLLAAGQAFLWLHSEVDLPSATDNQVFSSHWRDMVAADPRNALRTVTLVHREGGWQYYEGLWEKLPE